MKLTYFSWVMVMLAMMLAWITVPAYAGKEPRPLTTDNRIKQIAYDPNQVFEIVGTYGYQTTIELAHDEQIKVRTIGDSIAWQTVINGHRIFVKPVEPKAATNMTIVTDKRTYFFKLNSSVRQNDMTFLVRFVYPNTGRTDDTYSGSSGQTHPRLLHGIEPSAMNLNYSSAGDRSAIQLKRVFDDGEFTYFQFDKNTEIPSFYMVGNDGTESVVNTRREGNYMVVERTGRMFTLRNGESFLCVENTEIKKESMKTASVANGV